jgi:aminoacrylate hydrolase
MTTGTLDIGDAHLALEDSGAGPAIVCIHGLDGRASFWREQIGPLSATRRVITFDQRGAGRSSHSRIRYSVGQMAEDLLSMLDALDIETATLVGHGLGSVVALHLAITHAERVETLVLGAPWAEPSAYETEQVMLQQAILSQCGGEAYVLHNILRSAPAAWLHARPWLIRERAAEGIAGLAKPEVELSRLQAAAECNVLARLPHLRVRTLVIAAADDQVVPHRATRQVALAMPQARFDLLTSGGHLYPEVVPDLYNEMLIRFLDE